MATLIVDINIALAKAIFKKIFQTIKTIKVFEP